jgi:hypothetical protein
LFDFIRETAEADFSLRGADSPFFEYYLESGQTLLFFDGLDELPNRDLKETARDRIRSLLISFPGNTAVITSRIVGYDHPFRFDEKEFVHYRLTPLQLPEMERFVQDWYQVRIEDSVERQDNANDLIRILRDETHNAIRELAQNPLLLTIIALVHRIDAVLPDERVVLYQKCTETLLNTWHTGKSRGAQQTKKRGRIERRNRQRMEAIANWMHGLASRTEGERRAVVRADQLERFLTHHIKDNEHPREDEDHPQDQAREFLEFVREQAGLLIEVGDRLYSFVHLTFQEYLTASHLITQSEVAGVAGMVGQLDPHRGDPAWHEVIRLLVSALRGNVAQKDLVNHFLQAVSSQPDSSCARLLGGLLLDGVEAAEERAKSILRHLLLAASLATEGAELRPVLDMLQSCWSRDEEMQRAFRETFAALWNETSEEPRRVAFLLTSVSIGMAFAEAAKLVRLNLSSEQASCFSLLVPPTAFRGEARLPDNWESFVSLMQWATIGPPSMRVIASLTSAVAHAFRRGAGHAAEFRTCVSALLPGSGYGPLGQNLWYSCLLAAPVSIVAADLGIELLRGLDRAPGLAHPPGAYLEQALAQARTLDRARTLDLALARVRPRNTIVDLELARGMAQPPSAALARTLDRARENPTGFWSEVSESSEIRQVFVAILCDLFDLQPRAHWDAAIGRVFWPTIPSRMDLLDQAMWKRLEERFASGTAAESDRYAAAWLLLLDAYLLRVGVYGDLEHSRFGRLATLTRGAESPPLRFAHCFRELSYGIASRMDVLVAMVRSEDPAYRRMFEECMWRPTAEEEQRESALYGDSK